MCARSHMLLLQQEECTKIHFDVKKQQQQDKKKLNEIRAHSKHVFQGWKRISKKIKFFFIFFWFFFCFEENFKVFHMHTHIHKLLKLFVGQKLKVHP